MAILTPRVSITSVHLTDSPNALVVNKAEGWFISNVGFTKLYRAKLSSPTNHLYSIESLSGYPSITASKTNLYYAVGTTLFKSDFLLRAPVVITSLLPVSVGTNAGVPLAYDESDNMLYLLNILGDSSADLYKINPSTGASELVRRLTVPNAFINSTAGIYTGGFFKVGNIMVVARGYANDLCVIDVANSTLIERTSNTYNGQQSGIGVDPWDRTRLYTTSRWDDYIFEIGISLANPPNLPSNLYTNSLRVKVGEKVTFSWVSAPVPTQTNGIPLDAEKVYHQVQYWDGTQWIVVVTGVTNTSIEYTIPSAKDTSNAKFRVRSFVMQNGTAFYTNHNQDSWVESGIFTVYNNTLPTASTGLKVSVTSGQIVKPLDKVNIEFVLGTDIDVGDVLTGSIDYWNGEDWVQIAQGLKPVSGKVTFNHLIPAKSVTLAKYRVATFDGKEYGPNVESVSFNVSAPDPSRKLPNAFTFDGIDDYVQFPHLSNYNLGTTGSWEIMFSSKQALPAGSNSVFVFGKQDSWWFECRPNGILDFLLATSNGTLSISTATPINDGLFRMITVTYDGNKLQMYIDGVSKGTNAHSGDIVDNTNPILFGKQIRSSNYLNFWYEGKLAIPRVWNRVLTPTEIDTNKRKVLVGNESGLIFNCIFHAERGECFDSKNNAFGMMFNGVAWAFSFTPLQNLALPVSANARVKDNIEYLRIQTNIFRKNNGLAEIANWTDSTIVKGNTPIRAVHLNEIEDGLEEVYTLAGEVIKNQLVNTIIKETVLPKDNRFLVNNMISRFDAIVKALMNSE